MEFTTGFKSFMRVYSSLVLVVFLVYTYLDGRDILLEHRYIYPTDNYHKETKVIYTKINHFQNFIEVIFFPFTIYFRIVPHIVMFFNPK